MAGQFELKWQPVEASDSSKLLAASQEATDAYNKAIKDQIKVFDTMFNNAQQHKMNEVQQAVNALTLEQYNAPDARAKFDESITNAFKDIGGINAANQLTMDTVWDGRDKVLIDKGLNQFDYDKKARTEYTDVRAFDTTNTANVLSTLEGMLPNLTPDSEEHKNVSAQIKNITEQFAAKYPDGVVDLGAELDKIETNAATRKQEQVKSLVDLNAPVYFDYLSKVSVLSGRRTEAEKLQGDEKVKALNEISLDEAALKNSYGSDLPQAMKDPYILAGMEQYAYELFSQRKISEAQLQKTLNDIYVSKEKLKLEDKAINASIYATDMGYKSDQERNAVDLYKVTADGGSSGNSEKQIKDATDRNVTRLTSLGVPKDVAKGFIGDDGELNPHKMVATALGYANNIKTQQNNRGIFDPKATPYSSWITGEARTLAKTNGVTEGEFTIYKDLAEKYGKNNEPLKRAIVMAGLSGRLDQYSEGNQSGIFDSTAGWLNTWESKIEYVLTKKGNGGKGLLATLQAEAANEAFHTGKQEFRPIISAIDAAYEGGFNKFIRDNASELIKNTAFLEYIDQNHRDIIVAEVKGNGNKSSSSPNPSAVPDKGAGKTLGQVPQPTKLPNTSSPNTSVMTGLPRPNNGSSTQKGNSNNSKPQSPSKNPPVNNTSNPQGDNKIKTGQSGNNWERTKQKYFGWFP